jgi:hypothetical protein
MIDGPPAEPPAQAAAPDTGAPSSPASAGTQDEVLRRLMQRREQELNQ